MCKVYTIYKHLNSRLYHIFDGHRSLCGGMMTLSVRDHEQMSGNETYSKGQDCKACFNKWERLKKKEELKKLENK